MTPYARLVFVVLVACASAQRERYEEDRAPRYIASDGGSNTNEKAAQPPVSILKQINRHNEDGSYTYGFEASDGSFKIETKSPTGEVKGKYGYRDEDTGKLRVIEYGANKYGFQPAGEGITVAPPTLVDETTRDRPNNEQGGRGQYRNQDYDYEEPAPAPAPRPAPRPQYKPAPQPQQQYRPAPQQQYRPAASGPTPPKPAFFSGAAPAPASDNYFNPEPAQPRYTQYKATKPDFRPNPSFSFAQTPKSSQLEFQDFPSPSRSAPPSNFPQQRNEQPYSMLDELLKEYSLPKNGAAPLHDITFGSY